MSRLEIRLFGSFQAALAGETITGFESSKVRALLAYLAADTKRTHPRDSLAGLLWPDWPQRSAMSNLRYALADLRKNIRDPQADPPILLISRESIGLNPEGDCWVDVVEFEKLALSIQQPALSNLRNEGRAQSEINNLQSAINLYRGEFLEGFALNDSPAFEEWILAKREYYKRQALKAVHTLAETHQQRGEYEQALAYARRQLELEPWQEEAHRQVMRLLALGGQRSAALAQYETCQRLLAKELGVKPSAETTRLYEAIRDEHLVVGNLGLAMETESISDIPTATKESRPAALPTGTVTFLFTDIQGSTPLWEREPGKMAAALQIHNNSLRQAIEAHGGVVFKTVGDAFQAAFATAPQALKAAIEGQRALQSAPWNELGPLQVRMGLHTGEAELDPGGDEYAVSPTKNRAARIMSAGYGGQILLSQETTDLVRRILPPGALLKDLGEHRLKGLAWPERLYQVVASDLPGDFPPLPTVIKHPHNLPAQLTSFVGRQAELEQLQTLLDPQGAKTNRLVTLTGPGGTGKTRLSLQAGGEVLEAYPGGVWFVEFTPLADPALVTQSVLVVLGLQAEAGRAPVQVLTDYFRKKTALLILDNCEHLVEASARLCETLLRACPELRILANSREVLGVAGETAFLVPPLSVPAGKEPAPQEVLESDAGRLFAERASAVRPGFAVTAANAAAISQVCRRLDGIPLAIELAAARIHLLSAEQIAARLDDRFRLLTGGSRTALPRHRTLQAAIDWSWELLSEAERILALRLSVFAGGWTLDAAEAICPDPAEGNYLSMGSGKALRPDIILDLLASLANKSMILVEQEEAGDGRYRMLETIRQYAGEKLLESGESRTVRDRQRDWFLALAQQAESELKSRRQMAWASRLELEHDNLRLALEWSLGQKEAVPALRLASAISYFWLIHGYFEEGVSWLQAALALAGEGTTLQRSALRARACLSLSHLRISYEESAQVQPLVEEALAIYQELGDQDGTGFALCLQAWTIGDQGDYARARSIAQESLQHWQAVGNLWGVGLANWLLAYLGQRDPLFAWNALEESERAFRQVGDRYALTYPLEWASVLVWNMGDQAKARSLALEFLDNAKEMGSRRKIAKALESLSTIARWGGDFAAALAWNVESLANFRDLGSRLDIATSLFMLAELDHLQDNLAAARQPYEECLKAFREVQHRFDIGICLEKLGDLAYRAGDFQTAKAFLKECLALLDQEGEKYYPLHVCGDICRAEANYAEAAGYYRQSLEVVKLTRRQLFSPLRFEALGKLSAAMGRMEGAARQLGMAHTARQAYGTPLPPVERPEYERCQAEVRAALGEDAFTAAWHGGAALPKDEWIEVALEMAREMERTSAD